MSWELGGWLVGWLYYQVVSIWDSKMSAPTERRWSTLGVHVTYLARRHRIRGTGHAGPQLMTESDLSEPLQSLRASGPFQTRAPIDRAKSISTRARFWTCSAKPSSIRLASSPLSILSSCRLVSHCFFPCQLSNNFCRSCAVLTSDTGPSAASSSACCCLACMLPLDQLS